MKAILKNHRQSPRKVRLVADFVRGKGVNQALAEIDFLTKRAAHPLRKLIESAVANAKENFGIEKEDLVIKEIQVNKGLTLKRSLPRAFGRASAIHKHSSHVFVVLDKKHVGKKGKAVVEEKGPETKVEETIPTKKEEAKPKKKNTKQASKVKKS